MTERFGLGPFLRADDQMFLLDDDGTLSLIRASTRGYERLARARVLQGREAWGPMALVDGRLLLRDFEELICLDVRATPQITLNELKVENGCMPQLADANGLVESKAVEQVKVEFPLTPAPNVYVASCAPEPRLGASVAAAAWSAAVLCRFRDAFEVATAIQSGGGQPHSKPWRTSTLSNRSLATR
jgi:hypothetical protein